MVPERDGFLGSVQKRDDLISAENAGFDKPLMLGL